MKRRSFLQYIIGGVTALFLPKAEADNIAKETLAKEPIRPILAKETNKTIKRTTTIKWRRWGDRECSCDRCQQVKTLADRQRQTLDEICGDSLMVKP